jgi:transcriptional regulator with XRE-family HTH domain
MLRREITANEKDRKGVFRQVSKRVRISPQEVAKWLGCSVSNVQSIESGKVQLTEENASIIAYRTGVSVRWLLEGDISKPPLDSRGKPYELGDFEKRERENEKQKLTRVEADNDVRYARRTMTEEVAKVVAILLRGAERKQFGEYAHKVRKALGSIYFDQGEQKLWPDFVMTTLWAEPSKLSRPDLNPIVDAWEAGLKKALPDIDLPDERRRHRHPWHATQVGRCGQAGDVRRRASPERDAVSEPASSFGADMTFTVSNRTKASRIFSSSTVAEIAPAPGEPAIATGAMTTTGSPLPAR